MGSPENELGRSSGEKPHRVTLTKGHGLGETEATQGQYAAVKNGILDWRHPSHISKAMTAFPWRMSHGAMRCRSARN